MAYARPPDSPPLVPRCAPHGCAVSQPHPPAGPPPSPWLSRELGVPWPQMDDAFVTFERVLLWHLWGCECVWPPVDTGGVAADDCPLRGPPTTQGVIIIGPEPSHTLKARNSSQSVMDC